MPQPVRAPERGAPEGPSSGGGRGAEESDVHRNLYRIDDLLLRAGGITALAVVAAAAIRVVVGLEEAGPGGGAVVSWRAVAVLLLAAACPVGLVTGGLAMRRREKKTLSFWRFMQQNVEVHVPTLLANSDYRRDDLERAVRLLNNKALGFFVWDRDSDVIRDGRLESLYLLVDKCEVCRASIALEVPASLREIPSCPYCGDPVSIERLTELKREALDEMRSQNPPPKARERGLPADPLSIGIFLLLLVTFWPAALAYGWYKWQARCEP